MVVTCESVGTPAPQVYSCACKVMLTCTNSPSSADNTVGVPAQGVDVGAA